LTWFSWVCWIAPTNKTINTLFGVQYGLGMSSLTFDWNQIAWIANPLVVPWWAQVNVFVSFVLFFWIIVPIIYFTNVSPEGAKTIVLILLDLVFCLSAN
jgi:hypothetical protein